LRTVNQAVKQLAYGEVPGHHEDEAAITAAKAWMTKNDQWLYLAYARYNSKCFEVRTWDVNR
jgi:hypothetical protein